MMKISVVVPFFVLVVFSMVVNIKCHRNNVCRTYEGYFSMDTSKDCFYNPDVFSDIPHILERYVGNYENHTVITEDGYILTMFRIPKKNPKGVIVLKHQLITNAVSWMATQNTSLAFLYSNEGYDVWLPNVRGTTYSRKHLNDTITPKTYWDFDRFQFCDLEGLERETIKDYNFHENGYYDYPAFFDYIKKETGSSDLICIGHSASSTETLVYASLRPEHAEKSVKIFIEMAPTALFGNMESPVKYISPLYKKLENFLNEIEEYSLMDQPIVTTARRLLLLNPFKQIYENIVCFLTGWTLGQFDPQYLPVYIALGPNTIPAKSIYHYAQLTFNDGEFRMYDYGKKRNFQRYKSEKPPRYPLENIRVPFYMVYSTSDSLTDAKNAERLYEKLPLVAKKYGKLKISGLNHLDFVFGKDRYPLVVNPILELVRKISNNP